MSPCSQYHDLAGPRAPARELLGDLLLESKDARGALTEYEARLAKATGLHTQLVEMCSRAGTPARAELQAARAALGR